MKVQTVAAVVVVAVVVTMTEAGLFPPKDCKYWCKDNLGINYCCGQPGVTYPPFTKKHLGRCPPVRDTCTGVRTQLPTYCPHDGACQFRSKCCYDTCLKHHVCKTAEYPYY
uniref:Carcinin-like protein n=1 Tax=Carcinus maenas TaxID=6759 RepID=Q683N5_CARMA|nr:carcinin-like protein [Carcinus maenas]